jgi:hypothetical protein
VETGGFGFPRPLMVLVDVDLRCCLGKSGLYICLLTTPLY